MTPVAATAGHSRTGGFVLSARVALGRHGIEVSKISTMRWLEDVKEQDGPKVKVLRDGGVRHNRLLGAYARQRSAACGCQVSGTSVEACIPVKIVEFKKKIDFCPRLTRINADQFYIFDSFGTLEMTRLPPAAGHSWRTVWACALLGIRFQQ